MNNEVHPQPISERIKDICNDAAYRLRVAESTGRKNAQERGIYHYASDLLEEQADRTCTDHYPVEKDLLGGADNWHMYTWGGCGLTNDEDICRMFFSPSQQKAKKYGNLPPYKGGNWLDFEAQMAMKAKGNALFYLCSSLSLPTYDPRETSTVQYLVAKHSFDAEWTNYIAGKLVTKNAYYVKGCILECHSWRPEGYADCKPLDGSCSSMFLDHKTLSQYTASLY
jgi:hypothetical protein